MSKYRLVSDNTLAFADLWYATRDAMDVSAPHKRDLPLRSLSRFMPSIALVSFDAGGRAKYELFGTQLTALAGVDLTGHYLDETLSPDAKTQREAGLAAFHRKWGPDALRARWSVGKATTTSGRVVQVEDLALPYFDGQIPEMRHMNFATVLGTLEFGEGMTGFLEADEMIWFDAALERPSWLQLSVGEGAKMTPRRREHA